MISSADLNAITSWMAQTWVGRPLQATGPATKKAPEPNTVRGYNMQVLFHTTTGMVSHYKHICGWRQQGQGADISFIALWNIAPKSGNFSYVMCNVTDTILWQGHHDRVMQLNWLYFCGICQMMPLKVWPNTALGCNHQSICMSQFSSALTVPDNTSFTFRPTMALLH